MLVRSLSAQRGSRVTPRSGWRRTSKPIKTTSSATALSWVTDYMLHEQLAYPARIDNDEQAEGGGGEGS